MIHVFLSVLYVAAILVLLAAAREVESISPPRAVKLLALGFSLFALAGLVQVVSS